MNPLIVRTPLVQCGSICWVPTPKHRRTFSSSPRMTRPLHNHRPGGGPTPCSLPAPQGFPIQRGRAPTLNCTSLSKAGGSTRNLIGHNSSQHPSHPSPRRFNFEKKRKKEEKHGATWRLHGGRLVLASSDFPKRRHIFGQDYSISVLFSSSRPGWPALQEHRIGRRIDTWHRKITVHLRRMFAATREGRLTLAACRANTSNLLVSMNGGLGCGNGDLRSHHGLAHFGRDINLSVTSPSPPCPVWKFASTHTKPMEDP